MENMGDWEKITLLNELTQGRELTKQLQHQLHSAVSLLSSSSSSSHDQTQEMLIHRIMASYDKALSMLNVEPQAGGCPRRASESPPSLGGSPMSGGDSDRDLNDGSTPRKRKVMQRWTKRVRVAPGTGLEGPLDDGFSWRKYGQKDILGAKYPRGYYRCTHRNVQGCLATKQVQRSDDDPTIFEVTYRGRHTCNQHPAAVISPSLPPENQTDFNASVDATPLQSVQSQPHQQNQTGPQDIAFDFREGLAIATRNLDSNNGNHNPSSSMFIFPSTPENIFGVMNSNSNFSSNPDFLSLSTSGTDCFSVPPARLDSFQAGPSFGAPESELAMIVSAAASGNNPHANARSDSDLPLHGIEFANENIAFDGTEFFP
ncbi:LOW QUALITY PROTEIN: probable WRKY transcription factor 53 [Eucalyptus grandis]|uniref:LOW QUALITY PROTEIN: probable WRKY transcription factor 53 n=1 Tax=Eucalyptus grandis TaxID=71139 RepID=UPI00192F0D34|nr:LOW QUALITY PROTEIN: probable WRKY transcription factor 53 [Eucalyptus grandis]